MKIPILLALLAGHSLAPAATLYSTFGVGDSFSTLADVVGDGHSFNQTWGAMWANPFQVTVPSQLTAIRVAVEGFTPNPSFILSLWSGSTQPSTLIEGNLVSAPLIGGVQMIALNSIVKPFLLAGNTYWLVLEAVDPVADTLVWYRSNLSGLSRKRALTGGPWGSGFQSGDAFEIQGLADVSGTGTPEPATCTLVLAAGALLTLRARRI